jgi:NAD(P)H-dependent FMN reductase
VSRIRRDNGRAFNPFSGKAFGLCSSSDGGFGGARGLYHLRSVLMACRAEIITPQCSIPRASEAFDEEGGLKDERTRHSMETVCRTLIERARMLSTRVEP